MTGTEVVLLVVAAVLVVLSGVVAAADTAISRVSRVRVEELVREGRRGARRLQTVVGDPPRYVNVLLLLRTAGELTATVLVALICFDVLGLGWRAGLLAAGAMIMVSYVLIGVAPRTLGRQQADRVALRTAGLTLGLTRVLGPIPKLLIMVGNALTPGKGFPEGPFTSEAELRDLVDLAEERQVIEAGERQMIHSVFELGDTIVREVMVPRIDMVMIERTKTVRQALSLALRSGFSRIPVVGENEDDVIGVVYLKDLARRSFDHRAGESTETVESVMRPPVFVPESKPVDELLKEMQAQRTHVAIVIDEYGGTAGLVTIEDILEEIVGEITDEYDQEEPRVERIDDRTVRVTVRLPVEDVEQMYGVELSLEDVETVGGVMASALGRVPIPGASVTIQGLRFTAESGNGRRNRIGSVLITDVRDQPGEPKNPTPETAAGEPVRPEPVDA
jgi:CBS domain containing-hemolysin-like protein